MSTTAFRYRGHRLSAADGLVLFARDYDDRRSAEAVPVVCLAGLTRNSNDFHSLACRLAGQRRVMSLDLRGRGRSAWDPEPSNYRPDVYVRDVLTAMIALGIHRAVVVGTSLGGIIAMGMAVARPTVLAGVVLNDIGPELDPDGIRRIAGYAGSASSFANWDEAIVAYRERYVAAYPEWTPERWAEQAHHAMIERDGRIVFDYDPEVGRALAASGPPRDLWAMYGALGPLPVLILRGARSDLLNRRTAERMQQSLPNTTLVEVPGVGHAPTLDEDESVAAIESFLAAIVVHG